MSGTMPPAVTAELSIAGADLLIYPRFWLNAGVRVVLTLTDTETGQHVTGATGVMMVIDRPGDADDSLSQSQLPTERSPGVWVLDLCGDTAGTWTVRAESTNPRCSADRITFEIVT